MPIAVIRSKSIADISKKVDIVMLAAMAKALRSMKLLIAVFMVRSLSVYQVRKGRGSTLQPLLTLLSL